MHVFFLSPFSHSLSLCMRVGEQESECTQRPEALSSPGSGLAGGCEQPNESSEAQSWVLCKNSSCF